MEAPPCLSDLLDPLTSINGQPCLIVSMFHHSGSTSWSNIPALQYFSNGTCISLTIICWLPSCRLSALAAYVAFWFSPFLNSLYCWHMYTIPCIPGTTLVLLLRKLSNLVCEDYPCVHIIVLLVPKETFVNVLPVYHFLQQILSS